MRTVSSGDVIQLKNVDASAGALIELMGNPTLHTAISGSENRLVLEVTVGTGVSGRKVMDLSLPNGVLAILIYRENDEIIPRGETTLQKGDRLLIFGRSTNVNVARDMLLQLN